MYKQSFSTDKKQVAHKPSLLEHGGMFFENPSIAID